VSFFRIRPSISALLRLRKSYNASDEPREARGLFWHLPSTTRLFIGNTPPFN